MSIESIARGYTDPVVFSARTSLPRPDTSDNPRPVGQPTPYLDVAGPALVKALGAYLEDRLQASGDTSRATVSGYTSGGGQISSASRGSVVDVTA